MLCFWFFFFFKQKTAYEISECDWSSDVCSSDLGVRIDIRSETQVAEGVPAGGYLDSREPGVEYAEGEWIPNAETGEMEWHAADGTVISQSEWAKSTGAEEESSEAAADADSAAEDTSDEATPEGEADGAGEGAVESGETTGSGDED